MPNKSKKSKKEPSAANEPIGKQGRLFNNLLKTTQQFIQGRAFVPVTQSELAERLRLPEQHHEMLTQVLDTLVAKKVISVNLGRYSCIQSSENVVAGVMRLHPRGFGFVKPDDPTYTQDIFIPKHLTKNAVDGDKVEVLINNESVSDKGPEGRVVTITSRGRSHLAGIIREIGRNGTLYAYAPLLGSSQRIIVETDDDTLKVGDRIVMEVLEWGSKESATVCKMSHYLGHISDPTCDIPAAIEEFELRKDFPIKAVEEARKFGTKVPLQEIRKREDFRSTTCVTIDPDTAKDFDDAISLNKDANGHYHLGVHIADVSHYVSAGSHLDVEAQLRCNSTYFPGFSLPMLPRELSDNLCSLKPNVNRLTASVLMEFDKHGTLCNYRMTRSVIKSAKRFTYREAKEVLDGKKSSPFAENLHLMVELCKLLKAKRYERGSVEFGLPELVVIVNEQGMPTHTDYVVYDITHQLVEEFMLKANETVAWHLSKEGKDLTYRVHDVPSEDNMKDFSVLAAAFGFNLSPTPTPKEIQKLFDEAMDTPFGQYLATSYIRRMRLAAYSSDNIGHYGLSLTHYCHFTSPIRRYVDLVAHRILFHEVSDKATLQRISELSSEQERISAKAENSVSLLKKLRLLDVYHTKEPLRQYEAVVTRVKNFGIYFEVIDLMLENYLHVSELENDYYEFDETAVILRGRRHGQVFKAGDKITVMLSGVDFITLDSKWNLVAVSEPREEVSPQRKGKGKKGKGPRKKAGKAPPKQGKASEKRGSKHPGQRKSKKAVKK